MARTRCEKDNDGLEPPKKFTPILQVNIKTGRILLDKLATVERGSGFRQK